MPKEIRSEFLLVGGPLHGEFREVDAIYGFGKTMPRYSVDKFYEKNEISFDEIVRLTPMVDKSSFKVHYYSRELMVGNNRKQFYFFKWEKLTMNEALDQMFNQIEHIKG